MFSIACKTPDIADGDWSKHPNQASFFKGSASSSIGDEFERKPKDVIEDPSCLNKSRRFFVRIDEEGLISALLKLDCQLRVANIPSIISKKIPTDWTGREVMPGQLGLINHGGLPKILTRAGRYPVMPLRNWWARKWCGTAGMSDAVIEFQGLTVVQVSQNQAAVISDPQNQVFIIRNSGFVAMAVDGTYDVISVVDQANLDHIVMDDRMKAVLGWTHEVKAGNQIGRQGQMERVVATFINIPANNCAIVQTGDGLGILSAGQHCITNPNMILRGLYTFGEDELEIPLKDIFTQDQISVSLIVYLKWQLQEPQKLVTHGFKTSYDALRNKTPVILAQIAAHLDYGITMKQHSTNTDTSDGSSISPAFLDTLKALAMKDLHLAVLEYGITLKDFVVLRKRVKAPQTNTGANAVWHESSKVVETDLEKFNTANRRGSSVVQPKTPSSETSSIPHSLPSSYLKVLTQQARTSAKIQIPTRQSTVPAKTIAVERNHSRSSSPDSYRRSLRQSRPIQHKSINIIPNQTYRSREVNLLNPYPGPDSRSGRKHRDQPRGRDRTQLGSWTSGHDPQATISTHTSVGVGVSESGFDKGKTLTPKAMGPDHDDLAGQVSANNGGPSSGRTRDIYFCSASRSSRPPSPGTPASLSLDLIERLQQGHQERETLLSEAQRKHSRLQEQRKEKLGMLEKDLALLKHELEIGMPTTMEDQRHDLIGGQSTESMNGYQEDRRLSVLLEMVHKLIEHSEAEMVRSREEKIISDAEPSIENVLQELTLQDAEQRELLNRMAESWRADSMKYHDETLSAIRNVIHERGPFNIQGYLDEFTKSVAMEVRMLLNEVGMLRAEKQNLHL